VTEIRHLKPRKHASGRITYYWRPSPSLRRLGFRDRRLSNDVAIARVEAESFNLEADRYRADVATNRAGKAPSPGTLAHLVAQYRSHEDFLELAPATRRSYEQSIAILIEFMGDARLTAITPPVVQALKRRFADRPFWANAHIRILRLLFSFARREGWFVGDNPATAFRQLKTKPRNEIWTDRQIALWCEGDVRRQLPPASPELVLAMRLALRTGQRQGDLLQAPRTALHGDTLHVRQNKTAQDVWIPLGAELLTALRARPHDATTILVAPNGRPWKADHFRHLWRERTCAARLDGLQFRDLRRTAITHLAAAGCTTFEIAAVSGHSYATIQEMLDIYAPRRREDARAAIVKLDRHR